MRRRLVGRRRPGLIAIALLGVAALVAACGPGASPTPSPTLIPRPTPTKSAPPSSATARPAPTPVATPVATAAPTGQQYTVQSGDTLVAIAAKFGVTLEALRAANPQVTDPTKLKIGQVLVIPSK